MGRLVSVSRPSRAGAKGAHAPRPQERSANPADPSLGAARTLAASLYTPPGQPRAARRARTRAARAIEQNARQLQKDAVRAQIATEKAERKSGRYLPAKGEAGPDALRSYRRFKVQPHRATSEVLAGAYPFLAEAGLG